MSGLRSIGENDLHAYVDGALDEESRADVEDWLATHPGDRAKVDAWMAQKDGLHALYDGLLDEPLPAAMAARLEAVPVRDRSSWWKQAAAAVVLLSAGFAAGWSLHRVTTQEEARRANFVQQAVGAHVVFTGEKRHAVGASRDSGRRKWPLLWIGDADGSAGADYVVDDLIHAGTVGLIFGPHGTLKTQLILDLIAHIVLGIPWCGLKTRRRGVVG